MKNISLYFTLFLTAVFFMTSCEAPTINEQLAKQETEYKKVMAGHDEVMPMTAELSKMSRQMKKYVAENPDMEDEIKNRVSQTISKMLVAEEKMFAWMANIKNLKELRMDKNHDEIMKYLKKENGIMEEVKKLSIEGVQEGKEVWASLQPQ